MTGRDCRDRMLEWPCYFNKPRDNGNSSCETEKRWLPILTKWTSSSKNWEQRSTKRSDSTKRWSNILSSWKKSWIIWQLNMKSWSLHINKRRRISNLWRGNWSIWLNKWDLWSRLTIKKWHRMRRLRVIFRNIGRRGSNLSFRWIEGVSIQEASIEEVVKSMIKVGRGILWIVWFL